MVKDALNDAGPFAFGTLRFTIAGILTLVIVNKSIFTLTKTEIIGGLICGFCLFCGYAFQNFGLMQTSASKSAFITSVSVLMVPIILYLFNIQKIKMKVWFAVVLATIGLYFLLDPRGGMMNWGDILTFGCALGFAVHIIFQGHYVKKNVRILPFFLVQAWVVVALSFINSFLFEPIFAIWTTRLISALLVTGIAATFIAYKENYAMVAFKGLLEIFKQTDVDKKSLFGDVGKVVEWDSTLSILYFHAILYNKLNLHDLQTNSELFCLFLLANFYTAGWTCFIIFPIFFI